MVRTPLRTATEVEYNLVGGQGSCTGQAQQRDNELLPDDYFAQVISAENCVPPMLTQRLTQIRKSLSDYCVVLRQVLFAPCRLPLQL